MKYSYSRLVGVLAVATVIALVSGCDGTAGSPWADGSFSGTGEGVHGPVDVSVSIDGGRIADITIVSENETEGVSDIALEELPAAMIEAQSTDVDDVTGATVTSTAIKTAVDQALSSSVAQKSETENTE
tara:strand:- start:116 stop:502 length:387 start_codon:yes stop_codon:yes gene_type:complete